MVLEDRRVLFISYNGMLDPLGQSQVLPYLRALASRGIKFTLLSYERASAFEPQGQARCAELKAELATSNIEWHWLRYHQTPSLPATAFDVMKGMRVAGKLVRDNRIELVHARSHIPATIALNLKKRFGTRMIFDLRGLLADEYADAGHWQVGNIPYRITKAMEQRAFAGSDAVVTLTERIWPLIRDWPGLAGREVIHEVIPCCTNLELFSFSDNERRRLRAELGLKHQFTLIYSGSIDGWYLTGKMAEFFAHLLRRKPDAHFLWLTPSRHERIREVMDARLIPASNYSIWSANSAEVPAYLSAADAGMAFIKSCFSKLASSPTKYAEYLACGLPLIVNAGIGDSDALITEENAGVLVRDFNEAEYERVINELEDFIQHPEATRKKARAIAGRLFDVSTLGVDRYARLYQRVFGQ